MLGVWSLSFFLNEQKAALLLGRLLANGDGLVSAAYQRPRHHS